MTHHRSLRRSRSRSSRRKNPMSFGKHRTIRPIRPVVHKTKHAKRSFGKRKLSPKLKLWGKISKEMGYMKKGADFKPIPKSNTAKGKEMRRAYDMAVKRAGL